MKRHFNNIISVVYTFFRFCLIKLFRGKNFNFHYIERFSPNTQLYFLGRGKITFGRKIRAHSYVRFKVINGGVIEVGDNTSFNYGCMLMAMESIKIGKGVEFGPNVLIYDHDHDFKVPEGLKGNKYKKNKVTIGDNCWIGANSVILRGTRIGENCVVGAGAVIKGCFSDNSIIIQKRETDVYPIK